MRTPAKVNAQPPPPVPTHHHRGKCACTPTIAYLRVSKGREEMISPELQLAAIAANARTNGRRIIAVKYDIGSGRAFTRRQVLQIVAEIAAGRYHHVTLWKWSRWGRNMMESLTWLARVELAKGQVDSATEDFDQKTAVGRFSRDVLLRVDQLLSDQIGETWKGVQALRRDDGLPHSGRARFGYDYVDKRFVVDPVAADLLAATYRRYNAGVALRALTMEWNALGVPTLGRARLWTPQSLGRMLDTGFAAGLIRERGPEGNPKSNTFAAFTVWRPGAHDAIIDMATWDAYKAKRLRMATVGPNAHAPAHELSGLLACGYCGRTLYTAFSGTNGYHMWTCKVYRFTHKPGQPPISISNRKAVEAIRGWVEDRAAGLPDPQVDQRTARAVAAKVRRGDPAKLERKLANLLAQVDRILDMRQEGMIDKATAKQRKADVEAKVAETQATLSELLVAQAGTAGLDPRPYTALAAEWDSYPAPLVNAALGRLFARIVVAPRPADLPSRSRLTDERARIRPVTRWLT